MRAPSPLLVALLSAGCAAGTPADAPDGGAPDAGGSPDVSGPDASARPDAARPPLADARPTDAAPRDAAPPAPDAAPGVPDAAPPPDPRFPVRYDVSRVALVTEQRFDAGFAEFRLRLYRNGAYRCTRAGFFTFLVVEDVARAGRPAGLWVLLHGGGVGYTDAAGRYHGGEGQTDEETLDDLSNVALSHTFDGQLKDTVVTARLRAGDRLLVPSMCDHDLYAGVGQRDPHDPGGGTVDGLLATMAAIDFTARGGPPTYPTTHVFVHGTSAGSAGAWAVAHAFARGGVYLTGAVLDGYLLTDRLVPLLAAGCTQPQRDDPAFDMNAVMALVGPFASDPDLYAPAALGGPFDAVPLFDLIGGRDPFCCGDREPIAPARADAVPNNCRWAHAPFFDAVAGQGPETLHRAWFDAAGGHVLTPHEGLVHLQLVAWVDAVLARAPAPPFPAP